MRPAGGREAERASRLAGLWHQAVLKGDPVGRKERYLVGLDVGTSKITAIVGEATDDGALDIIGIGLADSRGIRRGVVVNLEAAVESIKKAIDEAELTAGVEIDSVHLGLSGAHVKAFNSRGVVAVAGKNREITREDVRRAIDAAKARGAAERTGDPARPAAGLRRRRAGRHRRAGRDDRVAARGQRPCRHRQCLVDAEHRRLRESRRRGRARHGPRAAGRERGSPDAGRKGARRRHRRRRRRDDRLRDLRARQPLAHRRRRHRRRSLHQRHRRRPQNADSRRGKDQAALRLRVVGDGRRRRDDGGRRASAAASRA